MRSLFVALTVLFTFAAGTASAQGTAARRSRCTDDAYKFCEAKVPDHAAVEKCLRANMRELSRACQREIRRGRRP